MYGLLVGGLLLMTGIVPVPGASASGGGASGGGVEGIVLGCLDRPDHDRIAMESEVAETCWMHGGHHTYFLDGLYRILAGSGTVFSVEQQFAPPTHYAGGAHPHSLLDVEVSRDGLAWTVVDVIPYAFTSDLTMLPIGFETRQSLSFTLGPVDEPFAFLRVHNPTSVTQGLSGFLDNSRFDLQVERMGDLPPDPTGPYHAALSCATGDVMESFFATHPCWFGGINRYDTPSFFHTYPLGAAVGVTNVSGVVQVLPWRSDDWVLPLVPAPEQVTDTVVHVQLSANGMNWTTVTSVAVKFGVATPHTASWSVPVDARFVRYFPDHHPRYDDWRSQPSLHHPEAFLVLSTVDVAGRVA